MNKLYPFFIILLIMILYIVINNNIDLYSKYYKRDNIYLSNRGVKYDTTNIEKCLFLFENDELEKSLECFKLIQNSVTSTYYTGVIYMDLGKYKLAIYQFNIVINDNISIFYDQSMWYKGLCLLKLNNRQQSIIIFKKISISDSYYKKQSYDIYTQLKTNHIY